MQPTTRANVSIFGWWYYAFTEEATALA